MANTYNIEIVGFQTKATEGELEDVVVEVHYKHRATSEDGENSTSISTCLVLEAPDSENFTAFEDLTEAIVKSWIGEDRIASDKVMLDAQLTEVASPQYEMKEKPW